MQVKAKKVLPEHRTVDAGVYFTEGKIYDVVAGWGTNYIDVVDDTGETLTVRVAGNCAHKVIWEVVDAS